MTEEHNLDLGAIVDCALMLQQSKARCDAAINEFSAAFAAGYSDIIRPSPPAPLFPENVVRLSDYKRSMM